MARQKASRENYYIRIDRELVEVTPEVYHAYYGSARQERYQEEKQQKNGVSVFSSLGDDDMDITEILPSSNDVAYEVEKKAEYKNLYSALNALTYEEKALIAQIYIFEIPVTDIARSRGVNESTVRRQKGRILKKLRKIL